MSNLMNHNVANEINLLKEEIERLNKKINSFDIIIAILVAFDIFIIINKMYYA